MFKSKLTSRTSPMPAISWGGAALCVLLSGTAVTGETQSVRLIRPSDLQSIIGPTHEEGVWQGTGGDVHYPDEILAYPVPETAENKPVVEAWRHTHRFFVIPVDVGIAPAGRFTPERVDVTLSFTGLGEIKRQPIVIDVFPQTGFTPGAVKLDGQLKLGADLKFGQGIASASAGANTALTFKYAPSYASVVSGFGSGSAFWQLTKTQQEQPTGSLPLKLVVAFPVLALEQGLSLTADVRVQYAGQWWETGLSVATFNAKVNFPLDDASP